MEDLTQPIITDDPDHVRKSVFIHSDAYSACSKTHAIVLCTEWDEFVVSVCYYPKQIINMNEDL